MMAFSKLKGSKHQYTTVNRDTLRSVEHLLDNFEKVSIVFLSGISIPDACEIIWNNIITGLSKNGVLCDLYQLALKNYQEKKKEFGIILTECLRLIQNVKVAKLLKLPVERKHHCINPVREVLFRLCEDLSLDDVNQLMAYILKDSDCKPHVYMEFNILILIMNDYISDGTERPYDFENLIENLNKMGKFDLAQNLYTLQESSEEKNLPEESKDASNSVNSVKDIPNGATQSSTANGTECKVALSYDVNPSAMGLCVIINQEKFSEDSKKIGLGDRYGTNADRDMLKITFDSFGYHVIVFENLPCAQLRKVLETDVKSMVQRNHSSFILCVLSHGIKDAVYCIDGKTISIEELKERILHDTCCDLLGKPKILLVQACQGEADFQAMEVDENLETDGPSSATKVTSPVADLLTFVASYPGYKSMRDCTRGSLFIQTLCKQLFQESNASHFLDICISVTAELNSSPRIIQTPVISSTFTKKLFFPYLAEKRGVACKKLLEEKIFQEYFFQYQLWRFMHFIRKRVP